MYIGEAELLPRRFQHYRTPGTAGRSQQTNQRLHPIMVGTLAGGGQIRVEIVTEAQAAGSDGIARPLDLSGKAERVLIEHAAEVGERRTGSPVINR